ncbi:hypothetical protein QRD43_06720 [Pelomonas sp. APW6]|uniref:AsmA domain-containing protein n=1 Tax=Roseateles subflavus TaxID=3053353 RepID=A0ABT7LFG3_9BURK|nr:hypothetical protein [Pelomonas sp. APW6]MDL5031598.1 hypothetical protein [Pelomonas sp. APW6]
MKKWLLGGIALLVLVALLVLGGLWWLHGNLDRLVHRAIEEQGSALIGAPIRLGSVHIDPRSGEGELRQLTIGNPPGFQTPHLLQVQRVRVQVDVRTLTQPVVVIPVIEIEAPDVIYEKGATQTNIEAIQTHLARQLQSGAPAADDGQAPRRYIVDRLQLLRPRAQASAALLQGRTVSLKLPEMDLRDLGRAEGGLTAGELGAQVARALQQRLKASYFFERALESTGETVKQAGESLGRLFKKR